jgi:calcium-dependent protein kinase
MLFGDVPWKGRDERDLLNNIKTLPLKIPPSAKLTKISETFLLKTLQLQEKDRIAWDEIF